MPALAASARPRRRASAAGCRCGSKSPSNAKPQAAMPQEARKRFTIEFRHHFQVPREVRTIKDRITQRRHKDFIDVFERELAGGTP